MLSPPKLWKVAWIEWGPGTSYVHTHVARPFASGSKKMHVVSGPEIVCPLSVKENCPAAPFGVTCAVYVTCWPGVDGFADDVNDVDVAAVTFWSRLPRLEPEKLASPLYAASISECSGPAETSVQVACPAAVRGFAPQPAMPCPLSVNDTVPPPSVGVTVAVKVTGWPPST